MLEERGIPGDIDAIILCKADAQDRMQFQLRNRIS